MTTNRSLRSLAMFATTALALVNLPADWFHPLWILAFSLPALVYYALRRVRLPQWPSITLAVLLQLILVFGTNLLLPAENQTVLGCVLVPPLVFLTIRREDSDFPGAPFLAYCVFLIGVILGSISPLLCIGFLAASTITLHLDAAVRRVPATLSARTEPASARIRLRSIARITATVAAVCLVMFQLMRLLPGLDRRPEIAETLKTAVPSAEPFVGLGRSFAFDIDSGSPLGLKAERLLRVRPMGGTVPLDMYLRCSYFDMPGLDSWTTGTTVDWESPPGRTWTYKDSVPDVPVHRIELEHLAATDQRIFVPAGGFEISDAGGLEGVPDRERFRLVRSASSATARYTVRYQDLSRRTLGAGVQDLNLTRLGDIEPYRDRFARILRLAGVRDDDPPMAAALKLAGYLDENYTYARQAPSGPHDHQILNFLEDRRGFCMHFASVAAICLRVAGIPCRIGTGLYGGSPAPDHPSHVIFGAQDAHAWVEIPLEGNLGWAIVDPTPGAIDEDSGGIDESTLGDTDGEADGAATPFDFLARPARYPWLWSLLGIVALVSFLPRRRSAKTVPPRKVPRDEVTARRLYDRLLLRLAKSGHGRGLGQRLDAFCRELEQDEAVDHVPILDGIAAYLEVRFGARAFDRSRRERLLGAIAAADAI